MIKTIDSLKLPERGDINNKMLKLSGRWEIEVITSTLVKAVMRQEHSPLVGKKPKYWWLKCKARCYIFTELEVHHPTSSKPPGSIMNS